MPVSYHIYSDIGLVHVQYSGFAKLDESFESIGQYLRDPGFRPGQKQLIDLGGVTGFERDFPRLLALQAKKAEVFDSGTQPLVVYLAPTETARAMARQITRSWEALGVIVPVVQESEADALTVLGLRQQRLADLARRTV